MTVSADLKEYTAIGSIRVILSVKAASAEEAMTKLACAFMGCALDEDNNIVAESDDCLDDHIPAEIDGVTIDVNSAEMGTVTRPLKRED